MEILNPNHLSDAEFESLAQVICNKDFEEEASGKADNSEDKVIEKNKHNSFSEQD